MREEKNNTGPDKVWHDITEDEIRKLAPKLKKQLNSKIIPGWVTAGVMIVLMIIYLIVMITTADGYMRYASFFISLVTFLCALFIILNTVVRYKSVYKRFMNGKAKSVAVRVADKYTISRTTFRGHRLIRTIIYVIKVTSFYGVKPALLEEAIVDSRTYNNVLKDGTGYLIYSGKEKKPGVKSGFFFIPAFFPAEKSGK